LGYSNSDGSRSSDDICAALLLRVLLGWDGNRFLFSVARRGVLVVRDPLANYVVGDSFDSAGVDHQEGSLAMGLAQLGDWCSDERVLLSELVLAIVVDNVLIA
jgi:hypothetical protein